MKHILKSIVLCIRYPFLYPRNRFTGRHYNNWKLNDYIYGYYEQNRWDSTTKKIIQGKEIKGIKQKAFNYELVRLDEPDGEYCYFKDVKYTKSYLYALWYYILLGVYEIIRVFHCIPTYTEWDAMPEGWKKAFGNQYLKDLKRQLKKDKMLYKWRIMDLKEKYGSLQLYCNYGSNDLYKIIDKYEDLSYHTCIRCGKPATKLTECWICPYCDDCYPNK